MGRNPRSQLRSILTLPKKLTQTLSALSQENVGRTRPQEMTLAICPANTNWQPERIDPSPEGRSWVSADPDLTTSTVRPQKERSCRINQQRQETER